MARRKPMMGGMRGGMPMRDGMMGRGGKCQRYLLVLDKLVETVGPYSTSKLSGINGGKNM